MYNNQTSFDVLTYCTPEMYTCITTVSIEKMFIEMILTEIQLDKNCADNF